MRFKTNLITLSKILNQHSVYKQDKVVNTILVPYDGVHKQRNKI